MKSIKWLALLLVAMIVLVGCQKAKTEPVGPMESLDLMTYFPSTTGYSWVYDGSYDYQATETITNIEEDITLGIKRFHIEGALTDASDGESGDLSYNKIVGISKDQITDLSGEQKGVLLQNPIQVGQSWNTPYFDQELGYYNAVATIVEFSEGRISVTYTPAKPEAYPKGLESTLTFEKEKGVTKAVMKLELNIQKDELADFSYTLTRTFSNKPKELFLRYSSDQPLLKKLYAKPKRYYDNLENSEVYWHYLNRKSAVEDLAKHYQGFLDQLDQEDLQSLILAKSVLERITIGRTDGDDFVRAYFDFSNDAINNYFSDFVYRFELNEERIGQILAWDDATSRYHLAKVTDLSNDETRVLVPLFKDAGIMPGYNEGYMYASLNGFDLIQRVQFNVSGVYAKYLDLLKFDYENAPIFTEGGIGVDKQTYLEHLIQLDIWAEANPTLPESAVIAENRSWNTMIYLLPNYFYEDNSFVGGFMSQSYIEMIYAVLEKHKESTPLLKLLDGAMKTLKSNHYLITEAYVGWINSQGVLYDVELTDTDLEAAMQLKELKGLASPFQTDAALKVVEVATVEELINAIGSNCRIVMQPGAYLFPYYSDISTPYASIYDGSLTIQDVSNLVFEGAGEVPTTLLSQSAGMAIHVENSQNIVFNNVRIGHSLAYCTEAALHLNNTSQITLANSILFGCGEWGVQIDNSNQVEFLNTLISDCRTYAVKAYKSNTITFTNTIITRNGKNVFHFDQSGGVIFDRTQIIDNTADAYTNEPTLFTLNSAYDINLVDSTIKGNALKRLTPTMEEITNNNSEIEQ